MKRISISASMITVADFCAVLLLTIVSARLFDINFEYYNGLNLFSFSAVYTFLFVISGMSFDLYSIKQKKTFDVIFSACASAVITGLFLVIAFAFLFSGGARTLIATVCMLALGMMLFRYLVNKLIHRIRGVQKLLVIESTDVDNAFARKIKYACLDWFDSWYVGVDFNSKDAVDEFLGGEFKSYNNIFITQSVPHDIKKRIIDEAITQDKAIYFLPSMYDINITKYEMIQFADTPSFRIKRIGLNGSQQFLKRAADIVLSAVALVVLSPIFLAVAAVIKADDGGSVLYSQQRVTKDGKLFRIYKFRTMVENAEKLSGPTLASEHDPRITRPGRFLRATRIDELPQLINIFMGDMSIVGPRPERPEFVKQFRREVPYYDKRHIVKAGLTGYAQVYSKYNTDIHDKLLYDLLYIREYSLLLDIKLMILTIKTILTKDAAEGVSEDKARNNQQNAERR